MKNKTNIWTIASCQSDLADADTCSWLFFEQGALGLETIDLDEQSTLIKASFNPNDLSQEKIDELRYHFKEAGLHKTAETFKIESLPNQDWLTNWKKHFEPFTVGNSFLICPPWHCKNISKQQLENRKQIIVDPGMAFGTGLHTTTSFCLRAMEKHLKGENILDVGTGSGILSIATALLLPEARITAIDIDKNSIENAKHNIELNHVEKQISLSQNSLESFCKSNNQQFDTLLSNLTAEVIVDCLPAYNTLLSNSGNLILAGIIEERLNLLKKEIAQYSFKLVTEKIKKRLGRISTRKE